MARKSLLWISHFVPFPPKGGAFQRSYNLLKQISKEYDVYLIAVRHKDETHSREEGELAAFELGRFCKKVVIVVPGWARSRGGLIATALRSLLSARSFTVKFYQCRELQSALREAVDTTKFDVIHFDAISMVIYASAFQGTPQVLNHHGAEGFMMARRVTRERNLLKKMFFAIEAWKLKRDERLFCSVFDVNIVVSEYDEALLRPAAPDATFSVIENGVDLDYFSKLDADSPKDCLIFSGRLDQYSNADGILWFCSEAWPLIRKDNPQIILRIIGRNPQKELVAVAEDDDRIQLLGYVDDVRPYFAKAFLSVIPLRDGGGTRIKVLDAMALGVPIIATQVACEGLHVVEDQDLLVANSAEQFRDKVRELTRNAGLRQRLANNARTTVEQRYGWEAIGASLCKVYRELLRGSVN